MRQSLTKQFMKTFSVASLGEVQSALWTTLSIYPFFFLICSTSLPIKMAVATMCGMFTGLCLSTIVMFLQHQPIACVWGLDLAVRRVPGKVTAQTRRIPSRQQPLPSTLPRSVDSRTGEGSFILSCQPREATFTLKHCKREKIANISQREDSGIIHIARAGLKLAWLTVQTKMR